MRIIFKPSAAQIAAFEQDTRKKFEDVRPKVQAVMAIKFQDCVLANFGPTGSFRPWSGWAPLSPKYAAKVGRDYATLEVTGRLKSSVLLDASEAPEAMRVIASNDDVPYATVHQYGGGNNIPAREYFPVHENGDVYLEVQRLIQQAAIDELARLLN